MILFKKMLRDIAKLPIQFFSIFLLAFCCMYMFCGITAEWIGIVKSRNDYYQETDLADLWINGSFQNNDLEEIKKIETVSNAVARRVYVASGTEIENSSLYFICPENEELSSVKVIDGEAFDPSRSDGVWIFEEYAMAHGYSVGDIIEFQIAGLEFETKILGSIMSSEYQYIADAVTLQDDAGKIGYVFCSAKVIPDLITNIDSSNDVPFSQIVIRCSSDDIESAEDSIRKLFGENISVYTRDQLPGISKLSEVISVQKAMSVTFPMLLFVVVIMSVATTINRLIRVQRIQLGTLRALGFQKRTLCIYYINYFVFIVLLGSIAGCIAGPLLVPEAFYVDLRKMFSLPKWQAAYSPLFFVGIVIITVSSIIAAYFSVNKLMKETPAKTLRTEQATMLAQKNSKRILHTCDESKFGLSRIFEKFKFGKNSAFILSFQWTMRDLRRSKIRTALGCVGTIGCTTLLVWALSCKDSVDNVTTWMFDDVRNFQSQIVLSETIDDEKISELQSKYSGECIMTGEVELKVLDEHKNGILTVTEGKGLLRTTYANGETRALKDGEISLSRKLAEQLGVDVGDSVYFRKSFNSEWTKVTITSIHIAQSGQDLCMTRKTYEDLSCEFKPNYIAASGYVENYRDNYVKEVQSIEKMNGYWSTMMESIYMMSDTMLIFAVLVAVTVLYNLGSMSFVERSREFAILRAQGFKSTFICAIFTIKNVIFALVGIVGGIIPGLLVTKIMCSFCGNDFDIQVTLQPLSAVIAAAITLIVSAGVTVLFLKKIICMDMVNSLKSTE